MGRSPAVKRSGFHFHSDQEQNYGYETLRRITHEYTMNVSTGTPGEEYEDEII